MTLSEILRCRLIDCLTLSEQYLKTRTSLRTKHLFDKKVVLGWANIDYHKEIASPSCY